MKVNCPKCNKEMGYPFHKCKECSWKATGKYAKKSKEFAEKYKKEKGLERKKAKVEEAKKKKKPSPNDEEEIFVEHEDEYVEEEEEEDIFEISCKCGNIIRIESDKIPLKFKCRKCGRKGIIKEEPPEEEEEEEEDEYEGEYEPPRRKKRQRRDREDEDESSLKRHKDVGIRSEDRYTHAPQEKKQSSQKVNYCSNCGTPMDYRDQLSSWYCPNCKSYY